MFANIKALFGSFGIGICFVFIFIFSYVLVPTVLLVGIVGISFFLIRDHYKTERLKRKLNKRD